MEAVRGGAQRYQKDHGAGTRYISGTQRTDTRQGREGSAVDHASKVRTLLSDLISSRLVSRKLSASRSDIGIGHRPSLEEVVVVLSDDGPSELLVSTQRSLVTRYF